MHQSNPETSNAGRIRPVAGKPILAAAATTGQDDSGLAEKAMLLGIDLGTSRSSIVSMGGVRKTVETYVGYARDPVSRKMLKADIIYGRHALDNRLAVDLVRPLEKGVLKGTREDANLTGDDAQKSLKAAKDLLRYMVDLVHPGRDEVLFGVIGVPSR